MATANRTTDFYPNLQGVVPPPAADSDRLQWDALYELRRRVNELEDKIAKCCKGVAPSEKTVVATLCCEIVLLTANANIALPAEPDNALCLFLIKQDGVGGWTVTWDPAFGAPGQVGATASTYSAFWFLKDAGKMRLVSLPIKNIAPVGGADTPGVPPGIVTKQVTLTANQNINVDADADGSILVYIIRQDAVGGWVVTWNAAFGTPGQPGATALTYSVFMFHRESVAVIRHFNLAPKNIPVSGVNITTGNVVLVNYIELTADKVVDVPAQVDGSYFIYLFKQDGAGGHSVNWNPAFGSPGNVGPDGGTYTAFMFHKESATTLRLLNLPVKGILI